MTHPVPPEDRRSPSSVDDALRRALEPPEALTRRLVDQALAEEPSRGAVFLARPALVLAVAAIVALGFALLAVRTTPVATPSVLGVRADAVAPAGRDPETARAGRQPVRLSISNEGGPITITTEAGTAWVLWGDT